MCLDSYACVCLFACVQVSLCISFHSLHSFQVRHNLFSAPLFSGQSTSSGTRGHTPWEVMCYSCEQQLQYARVLSKPGSVNGRGESDESGVSPRFFNVRLLGGKDSKNVEVASEIDEEVSVFVCVCLSECLLSCVCMRV